MPLVRCPKCNSVINTVYYPHWYQNPRPPCLWCRWKEKKDEGLMRDLSELAGLPQYFAAAKVVPFDPAIMVEDADGFVSFKREKELKDRD